MIPPGLHLLMVGTGHQSRVAEFLDVQQGDVVVRRWDPVLEDLAPGSGMDVSVPSTATPTLV